MKLKLIFKQTIIPLIIFYFLNATILFAEDMPIIIISAGKTPQSKSTVGSDVVVIESETIEKSSNSFLMGVIDDNASGANLFQMGGTGTNAGIQLRGLPKRYSTVYIDGVKMSDPSSTDNSFYSQNIMKDSIDRVEILKGSQSSLYGSNAIGGTINVFSKKGRKGSHSNYKLTTGENNTKSGFYSMDGANEIYDYYFGLNSYRTDGISAMSDNSEKDEYKNDSIFGNFGYKIYDDLKLENSIRFSQTDLDYDTVNNTLTDHNNNSDSMNINYVFKIIKDDKKNFKKTIVYSKSYFERNDTGDLAAAGTTMTRGFASFYGHRDSINFKGEYNFNLDDKIVFGLDNEFDGARYPHESNRGPEYNDEAVYSQYFDYQFRPIEKLYATLGARRDLHTKAGNEITERATVAYKLNNYSKVRSSYGTGIRFPTLYDLFMGTTSIDVKEDLTAEKSRSFDIGYETILPNLNLGLDISIFKIKYKNSLVSQAQTGWMMKNTNLINESRGLELDSKWKPSNKFNFGLSYSYTKSRSGNDCDDPARESGYYGEGNYCIDRGTDVDQAMVRVPRHSVNSSVNYLYNQDLNLSIISKFVGERRDYGNTNNDFKDVILKDYINIDLLTTYNLFDSYNLNFSVKNLFNETYADAYQYSGLPRLIFLGLAKKY